MNTQKRLLVAALLSALVLVSWPAIAAIVVTYTLQPVTISDMSQVVIRPGSVAGSIIATGNFDVKDAGGVVREWGSVEVNLTGQARTDFIAWANARMVAAFNTQRGL